MEKTVIFEKKYNTNIEKFSTTKDINEFIERKTGRELEVINRNDHGLAIKRN
ncbi:MAG: hypothetical protein SVK08_08730 [Halobacteriota archaeon]|nr:hypothetical protein [Halobacteriota archaeon]